MGNKIWGDLPKPIIGLSPMDGVTDRAMRHIQTTVAKPDLLFTEQISVETLVRAPEKVKNRLAFTKTERPIVVQLSGYNPDDFKEAAAYVLHMGFDGIDINLGCPFHACDKHGQHRGAGLIGEYETVEKIVDSCRNRINAFNIRLNPESNPKPNQSTNNPCYYDSKTWRVGLSVKTRLAETPQKTREWLSFLSQSPIDAITLHGRTLQQGYRGKTGWEEIGKMAYLVHQNGKVFLGNGDVRSKSEGEDKCQRYGCDGVLIGRAALGNPWIFSNASPTIAERLSVMLTHANYFEKIRGDQPFAAIRKHLAWYARDFVGAKELRSKLIKVSSLEELKGILSRSSV